MSAQLALGTIPETKPTILRAGMFAVIETGTYDNPIAPPTNQYIRLYSITFTVYDKCLVEFTDQQITGFFYGAQALQGYTIDFGGQYWDLNGDAGLYVSCDITATLISMLAIYSLEDS